MARSMVWETAFWSQSSSNGAAVATVPYGGGAPGTVSTDLVTAAEVESSDRDFIWVERIVGMVFHRGFNAAIVPPPTNIKERISVATQFGTGAPVASDPWSASQALDNFLWERSKSTDTITSVAAAGVAFSDRFASPWWNTLDVRVGRSLRPGQKLVYTVATDASIASGGSSVIVTGWVRVLLKR